MKYEPVIGLEIHVELRTNSKMFCGCPADHFGKPPNTQTCPVCLGLPGALPVPNKKAVEWTIMLGLALNCRILPESKFDRKHYFYPDLPKGYQISQYDEPIATGGWLEIPNPKTKIPDKIRITRVHLEEDTGKLQHITLDGRKVSLIDFNRSGVPLVEIVTEPDLHSSVQTKEFAQKLQNIIRYLEISDCDMEKGSMRLEANISLRELKEEKTEKLKINKSRLNKLPDYKVEVKNINSFRFLEKAIEYEIVRQSKILQKGKTPRQETRGWSEKMGKTISQRYKETAADYRYFPEPDIPPMKFSRQYIEKISKNRPKLPDQIKDRLIRIYRIRGDYAEILVSEKKLALFSLSVLDLAKKQKLDLNHVSGYLVNQKIDVAKVNPNSFVKRFAAKHEEKVTDEKELSFWIEEALKSLPAAVGDFKRGKTNAISVLIGKVMQLSRGKADALVVKNLLERKLQHH